MTHNITCSWTKYRAAQPVTVFYHKKVGASKYIQLQPAREAQRVFNDEAERSIHARLCGVSPPREAVHMLFRLSLIHLHPSTMTSPTCVRGLTSLPPFPRTFASVLRLDTVISQSPHSLRATRNSAGALKRETFYKTP